MLTQPMELPVIRNQTLEEEQRNGCCQACKHWIRDRNSYGYGVCILGGHKTQPRWSIEGQICDGFVRG